MLPKKILQNLFFFFSDKIIFTKFYRTRCKHFRFIKKFLDRNLSPLRRTFLSMSSLSCLIDQPTKVIKNPFEIRRQRKWTAHTVAKNLDKVLARSWIHSRIYYHRIEYRCRHRIRSEIARLSGKCDHLCRTICIANRCQFFISCIPRS